MMLPVQRFTEFINKHSLCTQSDQLLLTVSGGKDSVLMAHLFKQAGFNFSIAHVNFNLRGEESTRDEVFVRMLAETLEVPFFVQHMQTKEYAEKEKISVQMAARSLRYQWFNELADEKGFTYIAVAHHQTDSVETMLINLVRGTGLSGLHGILPKNNRIIRPLLCFTGDEITEYVQSENIPFVEDSSNEHTDYVRNKIRALVIPQLREINPSLEHTFSESAKIFAESEQVVLQAVEQLKENLVEQSNGTMTIPLEVLSNAKPQKLLTYHLLTPFGFSSTVVDQLLESLGKQSGTSFYSASHCATIDRGTLIIHKIEVVSLPVLWGADALMVSFGQGELSRSLETDVPKHFSATMAYIPVNRLIFPLSVRSWNKGDTFMPLGMTQFKKVSDFFIDAKVPNPEKEHIPIVVNGNNEIIWIAGMRQDERYKISGSTEKVAIFEWQK